MKKHILLTFLLLTVLVSYAEGDFSVVRLRCDGQSEPHGVGAMKPVLSWQLTASNRGVRQTAYRILVSESKAGLAKGQGTVWDSGKVNSSESAGVRYGGKPLHAGSTYYWKVMVWNSAGKASLWCEPSVWQMGLFQKADWDGAQWLSMTPWTDSMRVVPGIHVPHNDVSFGKKKSGLHPLPMFRKTLSIKKPLVRATAFISGVGHYELSVNGSNASKDFLAPGWTNYDDYIFYNTIDITAALKTGSNAVGVMLGNGFYNVPNERYRKLLVAYGTPKMICKILLEHTDGSKEVIISNEDWKMHESPITFTSIYGGEDYDATLEQKGWNTPAFNDQHWKRPLIVTKEEELVPQIGYPMAVMDTFSVAKVTEARPGVWVFDMGQNASAIPRLTVRGGRGSKIRIVPAELIDDAGMANQNASGSPYEYFYTCSGEGLEVWQPRFTYYGFRYIQIEGAVPEGHGNPSSLPVIVGLHSLHVRNSAPASGIFHCSNELFNRIYTLINWAIKSNIAHVVTDCPHREKLGWLEETYLMGNSIQLNYDMALLNRKMFRDMESAQLPNGLIPDIVPEYVPFDGGFRDSPEWGSAGVILPWYCYQWYGDRTILEDHYEMMKKYVRYLSSKADKHVLMHGLGDWFDMGPGPMGESQLTPKGLTPTATYFYNITIMAKIAKILGKTDDAKAYNELAPKVKAAFNKKFYHPDTKLYGSGSQTANAMSIYLGLTESGEKAAVYERLIADLKKNNYVLTAGDIGYHYLVKVLSEGGNGDILFKMNNRNDVPGYGYQLAHGASALTESWPALRNVSNNHLMLGHLMEWFYEGIGGIKQEENSTAYRNTVIAPQFPGDLRHAEASYQSPYGKIATRWEKKGDMIQLEVGIPVNTEARIVLPVKNYAEVKENGSPVSQSKQIKMLKDGLKIGSGNYVFYFREN